MYQKSFVYHDYSAELAAKKRPLVREVVSIMIVLGDLIAISLSFLLSMLIAPLLINAFFPGDLSITLADYAAVHDVFFVWMCPIILLLFFFKGHYTQRVPWWSMVLHILVISLFGFMLDGFIRFAMHISFSRLLICLSWVFVFFSILIARKIVQNLALKKNLWKIPTVVIADIETVTDTLYAFTNDSYTGYEVHTVFLRDKEENRLDISDLPPTYENIRIVRNSLYYASFIENNLDHFFVIALETFRGNERDNLINTLNRLKSLYAIIPPTSRISLYEMEPRYFFGHDIMLLHAKNSMFSPVGKLVKRTMDITASGLALLLLSPLIGLVALMLKIEGQGGTIFYGGKRIGRKGQKFRCWKFRTMEPNSDHLLHQLLNEDPIVRSEWEKYRKLKNDPRVTTRTSRLIRKTSIDELPQLWNVFVGDMSLVGPRPILDDEVPYFGDSLNQYLQVRPGITGLWQVSGRNETSFERRVYWDSWYVRNWSVWGDIVILFKTLHVVLSGHGAY